MSDVNRVVTETVKRIGLPAEYVTLFDKYAHELALFNASYDLVGADLLDDIFIKHILDSLAAVPCLRRFWLDGEIPSSIKASVSAFSETCGKRLSVADVGSGGGLPGIPLAIAFPQIQFTLIERMTKRCTFLENCALILNLKNVTVLNCEAERAPATTFDSAVFRAFRPLDKKMIKTLLRILKPEGYLAAYKARRTKIEEEMTGIQAYAPLWECYPLEVPFLGSGSEERERNLVVIPAAQKK